MADSLLVAKLSAVTARLDAGINATAVSYRTAMGTHLRTWARRRHTDIRQRTDDTGRLKKTPPVSRLAWRGQLKGAESTILRAAKSMGTVIATLAPGVTAVGMSSTVTRGQAAALNAFQRQATRDLTDSLTILVSEVARLIERSQWTRQLAEEVHAELDEIVDSAINRSAGHLDAAMAQFAQAYLSTRRADDGAVPTGFLYIGPIDGRIRRFCLQHVACVWSRPRIDKMNNGITPNTFLSRGGPNCRHLWFPVSDLALLATMDTGKPVSASLGAAIRAERKSLVPGIRRTA